VHVPNDEKNSRLSYDEFESSETTDARGTLCFLSLSNERIEIKNKLFFVKYRVYDLRVAIFFFETSRVSKSMRSSERERGGRGRGGGRERDADE